LSESDARGDVYSLGVSLFELLALRLPFARKTVQELISAISAGDQAALRELNPAVPWDAATVCATAIERDPARRYATAGDFARDLRNLLELRPITARVPSTALRTRRWIQRHPTASVACALGFLLLFVAPSVAWWRIKRERDLALVELSAREGMLSFLVEVLAAADPEATGAAGQRSLQEVVEDGTRRIREELVDFPEVRRQVLMNLSTIQQKLGRPRESVGLAEEALELSRAIYGDDQVQTAICEQNLAASLVALGEVERAQALLQHARLVAQELGAKERVLLWTIDADIAANLLVQRRFEEARAMLERFGSDPNAPVREDGQERVQWLTNLAEVNKGLGQVDQAEANYQGAVDCAARVWGRQHTSTARALQNLAALHIEHGPAEKAVPELEEARDIRDHVGAKEGIEDARLAHNLAGAYNKAGKQELALEQFQRSLALCRRFAGDSAQTARAGGGVGGILVKLGRLDEAEPVLREAVGLSRRFVPRHGVAAAEALLWLARCRMRQGDPAEAALLWQEVIDCVRDDPSVPAQLGAKFENEFADALTALERNDEAAQHRERAQQIQDSAATGGG
jgi:tetratricopeptide (TPR) repeat protein